MQPTHKIPARVKTKDGLDICCDITPLIEKYFKYFGYRLDQVEIFAKQTYGGEE
ncbi:MAG: hypothetical protein IJG24_01450 [Selenomonadaceae bacterium]|nr:hypothetical protein [Selenomonadaceae bacterium]